MCEVQNFIGAALPMTGTRCTLDNCFLAEVLFDHRSMGLTHPDQPAPHSAYLRETEDLWER
jgi:hypothetical protein